MVNYWFDTFKHLKSFDILPYQEVVDLYLKNQLLLDKSGKEKLGGNNERPINSDKEEIDESGFWLGHDPRYYNVNSIGKVTQAKADVVSMDMRGLGKTWSHFIYLELPYQLFNKFQTSVHSNKDISIYREFLNDLDKCSLEKDEVNKLVKEYDSKFENENTIQDYFGDFTKPAWRIDLDEGQYISIKENGIIYPICYNAMYSIFERGTHRSMFLAHTKSDVPIFIQYPKLNAEELDFNWEVNLGSNFKSSMIMKVNVEEKSLKFYEEVL